MEFGGFSTHDSWFQTEARAVTIITCDQAFFFGINTWKEGMIAGYIMDYNI